MLGLVVPKQNLGEKQDQLSQEAQRWVGLDTLGYPAGAPGLIHRQGTDRRVGQGFPPLLAEQPGLQETQDLLGSPS